MEDGNVYNRKCHEGRKPCLENDFSQGHNYTVYILCFE